MILDIQKFIYNNPTDWKEKLSNAPYYLQIYKWENLPLYGFKYQTTKSDLSLSIVQEARGLILNENGYVVAYPFYKFFNYQEPNAAVIDWRSAFATLKIDGSLITVFYYNNEWQVATSSGRPADKADLNDILYPNFRALFDAAAKNSGLDFNNLKIYNTYCFELVSKVNKVVIDYEKPKLYHIFTRSKTTFEEDIYENIGIEKPKRFNFNSKKDYQELVKKMETENVEGIVVQDRHGNRVKMKTESYLRKHYLRNNNVWSKKRIIDIILAGGADEVIGYFPEYKEKFALLEDKMRFVYVHLVMLESFINQEWIRMRFYPDKKQFSLFHKDKSPFVRSILFKFYDGYRLDDIISKWTSKEWEQALKEENYYGIRDSSSARRLLSAKLRGIKSMEF